MEVAPNDSNNLGCLDIDNAYAGKRIQHDFNHFKSCCERRPKYTTTIANIPTGWNAKNLHVKPEGARVQQYLAGKSPGGVLIQENRMMLNPFACGSCA